MKTKYLYVKNGKIELTTTEFEEIMRERFNEGYEAAKTFYNDSCSKNTAWQECPYKYSSVCPYSSITVTTAGIPSQTDKAQPIDITYCERTIDANTVNTSEADFTHLKM